MDGQIYTRHGVLLVRLIRWVRTLVELEIVRADASPEEKDETARACVNEEFAQRAAAPKIDRGRVNDIVAGLVRTRLERREQEMLGLASDDEFAAECDRRIAESIAHQEAAAAQWLRTVDTFSQAVA